MGSFHLIVHPIWSMITFGKHIFDPFLLPKRPLFKAFWDFAWAKMRPHGLKTG